MTDCYQCQAFWASVHGDICETELDRLCATCSPTDNAWNEEH